MSRQRKEKNRNFCQGDQKEEILTNAIKILTAYRWEE